jgi:hypothetical protein
MQLFGRSLFVRKIAIFASMLASNKYLTLHKCWATYQNAYVFRLYSRILNFKQPYIETVRHQTNVEYKKISTFYCQSWIWKKESVKYVCVRFIAVCYNMSSFCVLLKSITLKTKNSPFTNYFARGISAGEKMMTLFSGLTRKKVNLPTYVSEPLEKSR